MINYKKITYILLIFIYLSIIKLCLTQSISWYDNPETIINYRKYLSKNKVRTHSDCTKFLSIQLDNDIYEPFDNIYVDSNNIIEICSILF